MTLARPVYPLTASMVTRRCTQQQYLLRPDEETNNAVIYCLAVAAQRYGIEDVRVICERVVALHRLGRLDEAIADCSAAIALVPTHAQAWNSRGVLQLDRGRAREAIRDFDRAVALAPDWIWPMLNRARAYRALGDRRSAREDAQRASALLPRTAHPERAQETAARRIIEQLLN